MTWETVETWDIGFDLAAFNNRLTLHSTGTAEQPKI